MLPLPSPLTHVAEPVYDKRGRCIGQFMRPSGFWFVEQEVLLALDNQARRWEQTLAEHWWGP